MWTVIEKKTGKRICNCAQERDAVMMLLLGNNERSYHKTQYLMDQIIDIPHERLKELPGQLGLPASKPSLQENTDEPFNPF